MSFQGKTVLITGGGTGIGRETSLALAKEGAHLVIGNRNVERGEAVVDEIRKAGGKALFQKTDVTQHDQVEALVDRAVKEFGALHFAFNNAGVEGDMGPIHEQPIEASSKMFDINIKGVFFSMKYEIAQMLKGGGGAIVNNSSILGLKGMANLANYVATKHAVAGMTKSAALDYAKQNIRVNAVAPGPIETRMLTDIAGGDPHSFGEFVPMGRIGQPKEIANAVVWLLSDHGSYLTGHVLPVDGGWGAS